jgi:LPXTG-motif cell wall-anchored protein
VVDGKRRYRFPAATIGGGAERVRTGQVVFPEGSSAEREGGGGPIVDDLPQLPPGDAGSGGALPPEVMEPPDDAGGGLAPWLPAAGLALAGAAAIGWRRRR